MLKVPHETIITEYKHLLKALEIHIFLVFFDASILIIF